MSDNLTRAGWAAQCLSLFASMTGTDTDEESIGDLIANLGHYARQEDLDFPSLLRTGIGHWHLEQIDEESFDLMPTVTITINGDLLQ
ncbi:hypothetical protein [Hyphomicrobium sp. CS1BSMeth3]|uniref:hypothetical protein n=1 Tax=Hyphomicrobium sp. CS1BSMeth3 TaxID=1892844 RepID=UPI000931CA74|nr:hypothetical protein [Hyphomicrobium sp. CS1BSMeth3]